MTYWLTLERAPSGFAPERSLHSERRGYGVTRSSVTYQGLICAQLYIPYE